jgi:hypothetical protein
VGGGKRKAAAALQERISATFFATVLLPAGGSPSGWYQPSRKSNAVYGPADPGWGTEIQWQPRPLANPKCIMLLFLKKATTFLIFHSVHSFWPYGKALLNILPDILSHSRMAAARKTQA